MSATTPRSLSASESVSVGGKTASRGAFRVGRGQGLVASTAEPADLELILESGGRVRIGGYLLVPQAPPTSNGLVFRCNANGSGYWDSGAGLPVSWGSIVSPPTTLGGYGITDAVPSSRMVTAGAGLVNGGALTGDITLDVAASNGTIVVAADGISVGVITATEHGTLGGGSLHSEATAYVPGFMSAANVTKLAGIGTGANVVGPASSTDNALARFDGTTGKTLQNSTTTLDDSGNLAVGGTYVSIGASPALSGALRLTYGSAINMRSYDDADQTLVDIGDSDGTLYIGDSDGYRSGGANRLDLRAAGEIRFEGSGVKFPNTLLGFFAATPAAKPTVSGSRAGNAALADLLTELATLGLITNSTTA